MKNIKIGSLCCLSAMICAVAGSMSSLAASIETQDGPSKGAVRTSATGRADTIRVKGKGEGETKAEALKDAYRDAIERAVGMYVDSEQLVDNDRLIRDQILTHSNAYIDKYEEVNLLNRNGLLKIEIVAWVRKQELTQRLREVMPTMTVNVSKINQNLYAQIVTEDKRDMDAEALLKAEFDNFNPLTQLVKVTIVNEKPEVSQSKESDDEKILSYKLKFQIDPEKYFNVWALHMDKVLSQISISRGMDFRFRREKKCSGLWGSAAAKEYSEKNKTEYFAYDKMQFVYARLLGRNRFILGSSIHDCANRGEGFCLCSGARECCEGDNWNNEMVFVRRWGAAPIMKAKSKFYVALVKKATKGDVSGTLYELSERSASYISNWMSKYSGLKQERDDRRDCRSTVYCVSLKDVAGNEVASQECVAYNHDMSNIGSVCWGEDRYSDNRNRPDNTIPYVIYMTPFIGCFSGECSTWIDVEVEKEDVARISTISIATEGR